MKTMFCCKKYLFASCVLDSLTQSENCNSWNFLFVNIQWNLKPCCITFTFWSKILLMRLGWVECFPSHLDLSTLCARTSIICFNSQLNHLIPQRCLFQGFFFNEWAWHLVINLNQIQLECVSMCRSFVSNLPPTLPTETCIKWILHCHFS